MKREWKPGDVAMVTVDGVEQRAVRSADGTKWVVEPKPAPSRRVSESARPLVVIDPEDREQVERILDAFDACDGLGHEAEIDDLQGVFRDLADPPVEVFEHFVIRTGVEQLYIKGNREPFRSVCGKTWYPSDKTVATEKCPQCTEVVGGMWAK